MVTRTSPGSTPTPCHSITWAIASRVEASPFVGPYWSARAESSRATWPMTRAISSGGKLAVSGSPPASEITSGCSVIAIRSRITEEVITRVREAKSAA